MLLLNTLEKQLKTHKKNFELLCLGGCSGKLKRCIVLLGGTYRALGLWEDALKIFDIGLSFSIKEKNEEGISEFFIWKSNVYYHSGFYGRAIEFATKALDLNITVPNKASRISYFLGKPYLMLGDFHKYIDLQNQAVELIKPLDIEIRDIDMPWFLSDLANGLLCMGNAEEAYRIVVKQVEAFKNIGQEHGTPYSLAILGKILLKLNRLDEAEEVLSEALTLYEKLKRECFIVDILVELSKVKWKTGDASMAKYYIDKAIEEARRGPRESEGLADKRHLNGALIQGSRIYTQLSEMNKAKELYREAMALAVESNRKPMIQELLEL
jgi:tetratricopeptide (TPR) repeat protein